ncbi:MAG: DAK2 domain-containing protein [Clostridia bacterium]|nr:DAK2 domain-containing protein [Clostridia bacterium]
MEKSINGATFRRMINAANVYLEANRKYIDSLNVFPVPDGDTGINTSKTFMSATQAVGECPTNNLDSIGEALGKGALRGARGNSGVILSQILRGMSTEIMKNTEINTKTFAKAMRSGAEYAYKAVSIPKEGTILTVIRVMADSAEAAAKKHADFEGFFDQVLKTGEEILEQTPEFLPVLKTAGVVDAGGKALLVIFTGMYKGLLSEDEEFTLKEAEESRPIEDNAAIVNYENLADIEFAYCTEFMIIELNKKTTESDIDKLREKLMAIGDSVICIGDLTLVKIHVHTNEPNKALGYALELGEIHNIKIENMVQQNRELKAARAKAAQFTKPFGMVAVATGKGISEVFKDLGADYIVEGGQTMNPSAEDIAKAVEQVPSDHVFVFPNNKNIILAAEQAQNLTKRFIHVIPTVSVPEGISACLAFNMDGTVEENIEAMNAARGSVMSGAVTYAVRKTHIDGFDLCEGDIIGIEGGKIQSKDKLVSEATIKLVEKMMNEDKVNITLFYGEGVDEDEANVLCLKLQEMFPDCEVSVIPGGQPVYYYLISIE